MTAGILETPAKLAGKYLIVALAGESYGISVLRVREIIRLQSITSVPQVPGFVKGVINLRGRVIPIIDLRLKFGVDAQTDSRTCIVVVGVERASQIATPLGLIVDAVEEVVNLDAGDISPPPSFGTIASPDYLLGLARVRERMKALLNIDRTLAAETFGRLEVLA